LSFLHMADNPRIDDLQRRVQKDPASIAFAQLAEEFRRAGQHQEAVDVCSSGLAIHPTYLSARVTLGRALLELGRLDDAQAALETVLQNAPENLAAIRGLAEIHHRAGNLPEALVRYQAALALARNDPDLAETVADLSRKVSPQPRVEPKDGLSLEQMTRELRSVAPAPAAPAPLAAVVARAVVPAAVVPPVAAAAVVPAAVLADVVVHPATGPAAPPVPAPVAALVALAPAAAAPGVMPTAAVPVAAAAGTPGPPSPWLPHPVQSAAEPVESERDRSSDLIATLEGWLASIHVIRADRHA
jgi:tetratricopeptide repeat protein